MRLCISLAVTAVTLLSFMRVAHATGYLKAAGPTPLRFQVKPTVAPAPAPTPPQLIAPEPSTPEPVAAAPAPAPAPPSPTIAAPDVLKSLLITPLWAKLCDSIIGDDPAAGLVGPASQTATAKPPPPEAAPVVTVEMLADFFKTSEPVPVAGANPSATPPSGNFPAAVFVLPSSQAIYRSP